VKPVVHAPGEGDAISIAGATIDVKVGAPGTNGQFGFIEYTAPSGFPRPPAHVLFEMIEAFYVLEGELTMQLEDETVAAPAGSFVLVPPGVRHRFSNPGGTPARFLTFFTPGGFEQYFWDMAALLGAGPPDPAALSQVASRYDLEIV
jgi:mannose-6-phosphate isomerase-like protein (cupin superfamily)